MEQPRLKQPLKLALLAALIVAISGCSGGSKSSPAPNAPSIASGNWYIVETGTSTTTDGTNTPYSNTLRGSFSSSSSGLTGTFATGNNQALQALSGSIADGAVSLSSAPDFLGQVYAIDANIQVNGTLIGTYNLENGYNGQISTGTVYGTNVPSLSGTWTGTMPASASFNATGVSANLVQATTAATSPASSFPGTAYVFPLSGTLTLTNASCFSSGSFTLTIDPTASYVNGDQIAISAIYAPGEVGFTWTGSLLNPNQATIMTNGTFYISGPHCSSITGSSTTLTAQ
jgi:hypothetical protein